MKTAFDRSIPRAIRTFLFLFLIAAHSLIASSDVEQVSRESAETVENCERADCAETGRGATASPLEEASTSAFGEFKAQVSRSTGGIEVAAFADLRADAQTKSSDRFAFGALELGLSRSFGRVQATTAIVLSEGEATMTVGTIDWQLPGDAAGTSHTQLRLGRFDLPIGGDWQYYASKDRTEVSAPLTTEAVLDGGYNDSGVALSGSAGLVTYSAFAVGADSGGMLCGTRLGIGGTSDEGTSRSLDFGVSAAQSLGRSAEESLAGLDASARIGRANVRAEYLMKREDAAGEGAGESRNAWHITGAYEFGTVVTTPFIGYARYDTSSSRLRMTDGGSTRTSTHRVSAGVNAAVRSFLQLKLEYQRSLDAPIEIDGSNPFRRNAWFAQAVIVF